MSLFLNTLDPGNNANVVLTQGTQTIAGQTTFSSSIVATAASNQLILLPNGAGHTGNILTMTHLIFLRVYNHMYKSCCYTNLYHSGCRNFCQFYSISGTKGYNAG